MKSMKLASGFAVSALALAIAGQTVAQETTTDVAFTGSVKAQTTLDLENSTRYNTLPGSIPDSNNEGDEDWFHLEAQWDVTNGPFSGKILVGIEADDAAHGGTANVRVEDLIVEEGPIAFGQIGSIADSAGVLEDLTDQDLSGKTGLDFDVDGGLRYTVSDFGLKVQAEGEGRTGGQDPGAGGSASNFGLAAGMSQDIGMGTVWADLQYREVVNGNGDGMEDGETAFGVAAEIIPTDMVTLTAALRNQSTGNGGDGQTGWGARGDFAVTDTVSAYGQVVNTNTDADDNTVVLGGASMSVDALTLSGSYEANTAEFGEGLVNADASYDAGVVVAYVESDFNLKNDGVKLTFGATHTTDSGIEYNGEYVNANEEFNGGAAPTSKMTASAGYSF